MKNGDWKVKYETLVKVIQESIRTNNALLAASEAQGIRDGEHYIKIGKQQAISSLFVVIDEQDQESMELDMAA